MLPPLNGLTRPQLHRLLTDKALEVDVTIEYKKTFTELIDSSVAVAGLDVPENFRVGLDLTTAGQSRGPWDSSAVRDFLTAQPFDQLCVDFGAETAERFPLEEITPGLVMSLGVVDVSDSTVESVDGLAARIDEAATIMDVDDIAISTNGGFHVVGSAAAEYEHAKLQLVEMVARYFWGNEL